ncbi:MAG: GldG family protein [Spirochaetaceae bacterium]|jgi:gliding-associated putative ABC transporter substrate-binding component GldG|nr:GldG family protein [Spirochaetaceae bacterium]
MTKKQESIITTLSIAAIALALLLSSRLWVRVDLTADKLYTISPVSRHLAGEIPDQVKISYFLSGKLQQLYPEPGEIIDLVREYVAYSRGKISFTTRDPAKDGIEDDMRRLGIYPRQIQSIDRNEATVTSVYSGILIEYMDKTDIIPFIFSLETLEYDLTSRIRALVSGKAREAGIIIAGQTKTLNQNYRNMSEMLRMSGYKLREIQPIELADSGIPAGLSEIIVIGGVDTLNGQALYNIDHYIQNGGKALFMLGTFTPSTETGALEMRTLEDAGLRAMLRSYGVEIQHALVLDNSCLTITYQSAGAGGAPIIRLIRYPFWVSVTRAGGNPAHPITSTFAGIDLFWANPLILHETENVDASPLISSTEEAWLMTKDFSVNPDSAFMFAREERETHGQKLLGAALSGRFPPYFGADAEPAPAGAESRIAESRIVVIGNNEFLNDEYLDSERNLTFFLFAADWLANDDDIISIRSRASGINRLDKIIDPEKRNAAMTFARVLNTTLIPAAVLVFAVVFGIKRRKKTNQ